MDHFHLSITFASIVRFLSRDAYAECRLSHDKMSLCLSRHSSFSISNKMAILRQGPPKQGRQMHGGMKTRSSAVAETARRYWIFC